MKTPNEICYLSAENESVLYQWTTAIRILQCRQRLMENYNRLLAKMQTGIGKECLYAQMRREQEMIGPEAAGSIGGDGAASPSSPNHSSSSSSGLASASASASTASSSSNSSVPSSSNNSISSGCVSETSSLTGADGCDENGFDADFPDGGTIKRKPSQQPSQGHGDQLIEVTNTIRRRSTGNNFPGAHDQQQPQPQPPAVEESRESSLPPPPPPEILHMPVPTSAASASTAGGRAEYKREGSDLSLSSLPPPPEELKFASQYSAQHQQHGSNGGFGGPIYPPAPPVSATSAPSLQHVEAPTNVYGGVPPVQHAVRESLYPCGVFRAVFPRQNGQQTPQLDEPAAQHQPPMNGNAARQMELLKQIPNQRPKALTTLQQQQHGAVEPGGTTAIARLNAAAAAAASAAVAAPTSTVHPGYHENSAPSSHMAVAAEGLPLPGRVFARKKSITFNERVENLEDSSTTPLKFSPENPTCPPQPLSALSGGACSESLYGGVQLAATQPQPQHWKFPSSSVRNANPGRLFDPAATVAKETPPREFLNDLQRVMQKKWTVAQRFHAAKPKGGGRAPNGQQQQQQQHAETAEQAELFANHYKERDVSKWILQSLKHSHIRETDMTQDLCDIRQQQQQEAVVPSSAGQQLLQRPKIYNGRSVPNCYPPTSRESALAGGGGGGGGGGSVHVSGLPEMPPMPNAGRTLTKAINVQETQKLMQQQQQQQQHQMLMQQHQMMTNYSVQQQQQQLTYGQLSHPANSAPTAVAAQPDVCRHTQMSPPCMSPPPMIPNPLTAPMQLQSPPSSHLTLNLSSPTSRPAPPRRSGTTQLTSPR